jgi:FecR protein
MVRMHARDIRAGVCSAVMALLAVIGVAALPGTARADMVFAGNIKQVEGATTSDGLKIVRSGYGTIMTGKPGDAVFIGDAVKTGDRVKGRVELNDGTSVIIAPDSAVQLSGLQIDRAAMDRKVSLKVLKGTVRFSVADTIRQGPEAAEKPWKGSSVTIETASAAVLVRQGDLIITVGSADAEVAVLDGSVSVRRDPSSGMGEVALKENQVSVTRRGSTPGAAEPLASERRGLLVHGTTLAKAAASLTPVPERARPARTYTQNDVARDIAAGMTVSETLDRAVESGLSPEDAVGALIQSGVGADAVVYTAVQEGYAPANVVQSAITRGAGPEAVFSAALAAGASREQVMEGAKAAGMPPSAIAEALASGAGRTAAGMPGGTTPRSALPETVVPLSGGGGATPSASPYKP